MAATTSWGSDEHLQRLMDQRKRKRMVSNRESAKRSRMRKQNHLHDLTTQLSQLTKENSQIMANINLTMQHYTNVEAQNSVLRARMIELTHRFDSLNRIEALMSQAVEVEVPYNQGGGTELIDEFMNNSLSCLYVNNKPILASSDMIPY